MHNSALHYNLGNNLLKYITIITDKYSDNFEINNKKYINIYVDFKGILKCEG